MKKLLLSIVATALTVLGLGSVATLSPAYAAPNTGTFWCPNATGTGGSYVSDMTQCTTMGGQFNQGNLMGTVNAIINIIVGLVGFIAVVVLIIGGISFITSQGDTAKVTKARNTILYGIVGLVVSLLAFAIVNFVLGSIFQ